MTNDLQSRLDSLGLSRDVFGDSVRELLASIDEFSGRAAAHRQAVVRQEEGVSCAVTCFSRGWQFASRRMRGLKAYDGRLIRP